MKVLVTGGTGFVGSHTAVALMAAGHEVRLLVRSRSKAEGIYAGRVTAMPELVQGDIVDAASVNRALEGCEAVVHAAAVVGIEPSQIAVMLSTNARGAENVVGGAQRMGLRSIVHVSSLTAIEQPGGPMATVDSPVVAGTTHYGISKAESDLYVRRLQKAGAPVRIVYPAAILGPDDPGRSQAQIGLLTMVRDIIPITDSGFQIVDVRDLADIHLKLIEYQGPESRFIAASAFLSWTELADRVDRLTGIKGSRMRIPGGVLRAAGGFCDALKRVFPFDFPLSRESAEFASLWTPADGSSIGTTLGIQYRDTDLTLGDALRSLYQRGELTTARAGQLAN